jgi:acetyl esterase/lipase
MNVTKLWPDEYDDLRTEARDMGAMVAELLPRGGAGEDGEPLDPAARVEQMRAALAAIEVADPRAVDEDVAGVPCRVFRPEGAAPTAVYLDFHGGGMMIGSPRLDDTRNAAYMEQLGVAVVSVDYRLAPEHPFPEGSDDCLAVAAWLVEHAEAAFGTPRLLIGGESAGGYYTAQTLLRVRDELGPEAVGRFAAANLIFGVFDISRTPSQRGIRVCDAPDMLDAGGIEFFSEQYTPGLSEGERRSPAVSPLYADVHGLPPAIFTVGTADHLLDDSLFLAQRWAAAGNETELAVFPDCGHGFTAFPTELAKRANERISAFLVTALG